MLRNARFHPAMDPRAELHFDTSLYLSMRWAEPDCGFGPRPIRDSHRGTRPGGYVSRRGQQRRRRDVPGLSGHEHWPDALGLRLRAAGRRVATPRHGRAAAPAPGFRLRLGRARRSACSRGPVHLPPGRRQAGSRLGIWRHALRRKRRAAGGRRALLPIERLRALDRRAPRRPSDHLSPCRRQAGRHATRAVRRQRLLRPGQFARGGRGRVGRRAHGVASHFAIVATDHPRRQRHGAARRRCVVRAAPPWNCGSCCGAPTKRSGHRVAQPRPNKTTNPSAIRWPRAVNWASTVSPLREVV